MSESKVNPQVLLVEDDHTTQAMITALLGKLDVSLLIAKDGNEARKALLEKKFDLVLMDISLPGPSGIELCNEIRAREKGTTARTLIVALTGMNGPDDRKSLLEGGMDGYFPKPVDRLKLQGFVMNLFKMGK